MVGRQNHVNKVHKTVTFIGFGIKIPADLGL